VEKKGLRRKKNGLGNITIPRERILWMLQGAGRQVKSSEIGLGGAVRNQRERFMNKDQEEKARASKRALC